MFWYLMKILRFLYRKIKILNLNYIGLNDFRGYITLKLKVLERCLNSML